MSPFEFAFQYVLQNEGGYSEHAADRGGRTAWGVTESTATEYGLDFENLTLAQARDVYRDKYWMFDGINDRRLAAKCFDVVVNFGKHGGTRVLQRACGVTVDGIYGNDTEARLKNASTEDMLQRIASAAADRYVEICLATPTQMVFLKGWIRRAIKLPPISFVDPPIDNRSK